ncbi:pseudouridine synthase [Tenacibaculum sp. SG-28]|uniref:pseudouridine synthase n=1 Tax=Tenacibaculum sp. SG-28 TaxID=754426 RepID=UPI001E51A0B7|nr:pseudouridine synthase [Tenacibaculum sp. SG-28]
MKIKVLYQDAYIVCVSKPNNVVVHHAHHSRNVADEKSLLQHLNAIFDKQLYPIHRLDRKTSGVIILARETKYVSKFQALFTEQSIHKVYFGLVRGHSPSKTIIDSPVKGRDAKVYKDAITQLESLEHITLNIPVKPYETSRYSLVKLTPKTGRLHQLRIHCTKISHPLIGDPKYGDKNHNVMFEKEFQCENLFYMQQKLNLSTHF